MEEKIIKITKMLVKISLIVLLFGCRTKLVKYYISNTYSGPGLVFIYPLNSYNNGSDSIVISNGLGRINEKQMKQKFIFKSIESESEIDIVPIGKTGNINDNSRYVFELVNGTSSSDCYNKDLRTIRFFIGSKSDYEKWGKNYHNDLDYFSSKGIDWCKYYIEPLAIDKNK